MQAIPRQMSNFFVIRLGVVSDNNRKSDGEGSDSVMSVHAACDCQ